MQNPSNASRHFPGMGPVVAPVIAAVLLSLPLVAAADIYSSTDADGVVRYASQAIDASYALYLRDDTIPARPVRASTVRTGHKASATTTRATPRQAVRSGALESLIDDAARRHAVDAALIRAVVDVESGANPRAVSPKGAAGAMQLMAATAAMYGVSERMDPAQNIDAGVRHLKYLLGRHGGNVALALAAYNAGEGAVARYAGRIPPFRETMLYVPAVLARMQRADAVKP